MHLTSENHCPREFLETHEEARIWPLSSSWPLFPVERWSGFPQPLPQKRTLSSGLSRGKDTWVVEGSLFGSRASISSVWTQGLTVHLAFLDIILPVRRSLKAPVPSPPPCSSYDSPPLLLWLLFSLCLRLVSSFSSLLLHPSSSLSSFSSLCLPFPAHFFFYSCPLPSASFFFFIISCFFFFLLPFPSLFL